MPLKSYTNRPATAVAFINVAHFIDHYAMLVFAAAVVTMAPIFGRSYSGLLTYATPGFVAFGAGSLVSGWLGDRWSRRHMMVIFFLGIGLSLVLVGLAGTPLQLGAALFAVGAFASIYHPVGTAMLVSYADGKLGRAVGINGVWGNLGVAISALSTGILVNFLGWRAAFTVPGILVFAIGIVFMRMVRHEVRSGHKTASASVELSPATMRTVLIVLILAVIGVSTTFNAVTVSLPKLFEERLTAITTNASALGMITAVVYLFGAVTQYTIGNFLDKHSLKSVFVPLSLTVTPLLFVAAYLQNFALLVVSALIIMGVFGQITVSDALVGRYTADAWRARAYAMRYFLGFTAAGVSVPLVARLHEVGGFALLLQVLALMYCLVIAAAFIFPGDKPSVAGP